MSRKLIVLFTLSKVSTVLPKSFFQTPHWKPRHCKLSHWGHGAGGPGRVGSRWCFVSTPCTRLVLGCFGLMCCSVKYEKAIRLRLSPHGQGHTFVHSYPLCLCVLGRWAPGKRHSFRLWCCKSRRVGTYVCGSSLTLRACLWGKVSCCQVSFVCSFVCFVFCCQECV